METLSIKMVPIKQTLDNGGDEGGNGSGEGMAVVLATQTMQR